MAIRSTEEEEESRRSASLWLQSCSYRPGGPQNPPGPAQSLTVSPALKMV